MGSVGIAGCIELSSDGDWDFASDGVVEYIPPIDVVKLFKSVIPEFVDDNAEIMYQFDEAKKVLNLTVPALGMTVSVSDLNKEKKWGKNADSDSLVFRSLLREHGILPEMIMKLNEVHPNIKLYSSGSVLVIEEAYYLSHGIPVQNVLDRVYAFVTTINAVLDLLKFPEPDVILS